MTRKEYISELVERLGSNMAEMDRMEAVRYYQEYFDEAGPECEEEVIKNLGTPAQVAKQILADYAVKEIVSKPESPKKGISAIWWIIIAIIASPIAFPVAMTAIGLVIGLVATIGGLLIAGLAVVFALGVSGTVILGSGISMITLNPASGAICLGIALVLIGMTILVGIGLYLFCIRVMPVVIQKVYALIKRLMQRGRNNE